MLEKYKELNDDARDYFLAWLTDKIKDDDVLTRCKKEVDILYDNGLLFIIEFLHKYKEANEEVNFHFRGMANNLLLLYVLGISKVDPIKYNLPYELFRDYSLDIDFINGCSLDFVSSVEKYARDFRIVRGSFEPGDVDEINEFEDKHYLLIPCYVKPQNMTFRLNEFNQFETIEDYHLFTDEYIVIRLDDKPMIQEKKVNIKYAMHTDFEEEVAKQLKPKTLDDYVKVISLAHGVYVWDENQEELFKAGKIDIHNIISNREDVYEYLINHSIDKELAFKIITFIRKGKARIDNYQNEWEDYKNIMLNNKCEEWFINVCSKIRYLFGRGQAVSECLYALYEKNYYDIE